MVDIDTHRLHCHSFRQILGIHAISWPSASLRMETAKAHTVRDQRHKAEPQRWGFVVSLGWGMASGCQTSPLCGHRTHVRKTMNDKLQH